MNIQAMMKQAQEMQERLKKQMSDLRVEATAGGGMVTVVVSGDKQLQSLKIDPEVVSKDDVEIVQEQNRLSVRGKLKEADSKTYLHHGIATRAFERHFDLADYVEVKRASFEDGLLQIELQREVPESMKPRKIQVQIGKPQLVNNQAKAIEHSKVA